MRRIGMAPRAAARESYLSGVRTKRDGSRDGKVTSLDALMILQAAAGAISL
jgi:hypothetical protein